MYDAVKQHPTTEVGRVEGVGVFNKGPLCMH